MPIRVLCDGRVTLPESLRQEFGLLPGDPVLYTVRGKELILTRVTPQRGLTLRRGGRGGRLLPLPFRAGPGDAEDADAAD